MTFADSLDFPLLRDLLGVAEHESDRAVMRAARSMSPLLPQMVLSVAARGKMPIGSGSADALRRARARAAHYDRLHEAIDAVAPARVLKGATLARFYPPDLVRPCNDLDLLVRDEVSLWAAARVVRDREEVEATDLSLLRHEGRTHLVLSLSWATDDPLLDKDFKVELSTVALVGDHVRVPPATTLPDGDAPAVLVCLAEERFQREFTIRDFLDVLMVFDHRPPSPAELARTATEYRRAPELLELLEGALAVHYSPELAECVEALRTPADAESARRPGERADVPKTVEARLAAGLPVHGLLLRAARREWPASRFHEVDGVHLLRTPIGDYLMVTGELVSVELYEAALRQLDALEVDEP